jgi:hypothetical protein
MYCGGSQTVFVYGIVFRTTRGCITLNMQVSNTSGELETHVHETWRVPSPPPNIVLAQYHVCLRKIHFKQNHL